jgi:molecular chaperone DnaJ
VPTLGENRRTTLKIPAGTQDGTVFRIRGRGMPTLRGGERGDQLVRIHIEVPKKLSNEQREKLEAFAIASGDAANPIEESWWQKALRLFE